MPIIPYGTQWIDDDDIKRVESVLRSDFLTQGPAVAEFEAALCAYTGARFAVVVSNATAALHLAVNVLELEPDAEGITSPNTFVASANALVYNGVKPVFADIDALTLNIDPAEIEQQLTPRTKVLIPVHFAGRPCDWPRMNALAKEHHLFVIEDAAHAIGSGYNPQSDMTVFSFHPVKNMTTGEGGAILTDNPELHEKLLRRRSHGIVKQANSWFYEMQDIGYNYRMTDMQAALGTSQLSKLNRFKARRTQIVSAYQRGLAGLSCLRLPLVADDSVCFHLFVVQIDFATLGKPRTQVMNELIQRGVGTQVHYIPVHTQPYYQTQFGYKAGDYPVAEAYYERALSLPLYPKMTDDDVAQVIAAVREVVS